MESLYQAMCDTVELAQIFDNSFFEHLVTQQQQHSEKGCKCKYDSDFLMKMWFYFRVFDQEALSKYPDNENIMKEVDVQDVKTIVEENLKNNETCQDLYKIMLSYFYVIINDPNPAGIIRVTPNLQGQNTLIIIRVRDKFLLCEMPVSIDITSQLNSLYAKQGHFGNIVLTDYYSE